MGGFRSYSGEKKVTPLWVEVSRGGFCILKKGAGALWNGEKTLRELWKSFLTLTTSPWQF